MRRLTLGLAAASAFLVAPLAVAADLPARYPAPAPVAYISVPAFTWSGPYVGAVAGYAWSKQTAEGAVINGQAFNLAGFPDRSIESDGFSIGGTVGYNVQLSNGIVLGAEADLAWANIEGSRQVGPVSIGVKTDWYGTARVRVGYAFDRFLPYVTGGAIYTNSTLSGVGFGQGASSEQGAWGWVVGAGVEYALTDRWSTKVEYLHGRVDQEFGAVIGRNSGQVSGEQRIDIVRAGLNYRF